MTGHINNLNTLFAKLSPSDFNIEENKRVELLLKSLPNYYDPLIINITNHNIVICLTFDDVEGVIQEEKSRQKNKEDRLENTKQV